MVEERRDGEDGKRKFVNPVDFISESLKILEELCNSKNIPVPKEAFYYLYMGIYTSIIIYSIVGFSTDIEIIKKYLYALPFFVIFIIYFLKSVELFRKISKRLFSMSDLEFEDFKKDKKAHSEIAWMLESRKYNEEQYKEMVDDMINDGTFDENIQVAIFTYYDAFNRSLKNFIHSKLNTYIWTNGAVCKFLYESEGTLEKGSLTSLVYKYGTSPSVMFTLGRFHLFEFSSKNTVKEKYYNAGFNYAKDKTVFILNFLYFVTFFGISILLIVKYNLLNNQNFLAIHLVASIFLYYVTSFYARKEFFEIGVKKSLGKEKLKFSKVQFDIFIKQIKRGK